MTNATLIFQELRIAKACRLNAGRAAHKAVRDESIALAKACIATARRLRLTGKYHA